MAAIPIQLRGVSRRDPVYQLGHERQERPLFHGLDDVRRAQPLRVSPERDIPAHVEHDRGEMRISRAPIEHQMEAVEDAELASRKARRALRNSNGRAARSFERYGALAA
jgi:hypothetical protein